MWKGPQLDPHEKPERLPVGVKYEKLDTVIGTSHLALYLPAEPQKLKKWIVYTHGIMHHCENMLRIFDDLHDTANVVMWDYRGFGRSTGEADRKISIYDLYAVLHYVRTEYEIEEVILMGSSLGSNVVLHFLDTFKGRCKYVSSVILCHPFYSLRNVFEHIGAPGTLAYILGNMDVREALPEWLRLDTKRKALVIGSSEDTITPWEEIRDDAHQITCVDVGGAHFQFNELLLREIHKWCTE